MSSCGSFLCLTDAEETSPEAHVHMEAVEAEMLTAEQEEISTIENTVEEETKAIDASEEEESTRESGEVQPESITETNTEKKKIKMVF